MAVAMYQNVVPLNRNTHRRTRLRRIDGATFAAHMNSVPLALAEFAAAARDHAIVFARLDDGGFVPAIVVGLADRRNLCLDAHGRWAHGYAPAFLRQYPFVLADGGTGHAPTVCLDLAFEGVGEDEGDPLFDEQGEETPLLRGAMEFLSHYHAELKRTAVFAARLRDAGLLEARVLRVRHADGGEEELSGLYVVSEDKLTALHADLALPLLRSGELGAVYAHLHSLRNLDRLTELRARRRADVEEDSTVVAAD